MSEHLDKLLAPIQERQMDRLNDSLKARVTTRLIAANFIIGILGSAMKLSYGEVVRMLAQETKSQEIFDDIEFAVAIAVAGIGQEKFEQEFTRRREEYYSEVNH